MLFNPDLYSVRSSIFVCALCMSFCSSISSCFFFSCVVVFFFFLFVFFQAEDGIRDLVRSRGLGDVYKRQRLVTLDV